MLTRKIFARWIGLAFALLSVNANAAVLNYLETWDLQGDLAGWQANTTDATVINPGAGGNGEGYLLSRRSGAFPIGAATLLPEATNNFAPGVWTANVDLRGLEGTTSDVFLRFRYLDSSNNGWYFRLADVLTDAWTTHTVTFNTSWSDADATAAGWTQEAISPSFATTMSDVYTTEVRVEGTSTLLVGIDNFQLIGPNAVPLPAPLALFALGVVSLTLRTRRLSQ